MEDNKKQKITFIQYKDSYDIHFDGIKMENLTRLKIEEGQEIKKTGRIMLSEDLPYIKLDLEVEVPRDEVSIIRK